MEAAAGRRGNFCGSGLLSTMMRMERTSRSSSGRMSLSIGSPDRRASRASGVSPIMYWIPPSGRGCQPNWMPTSAVATTHAMGHIRIPPLSRCRGTGGNISRPVAAADRIHYIHINVLAVVS